MTLRPRSSRRGRRPHAGRGLLRCAADGTAHGLRACWRRLEIPAVRVAEGPGTARHPSEGRQGRRRGVAVHVDDQRCRRRRHEGVHRPDRHQGQPVPRRLRDRPAAHPAGSQRQPSPAPMWSRRMRWRWRPSARSSWWSPTPANAATWSGAEGKFENWTADRYNLFAPSWNTTKVPAGDQPKTWEDLANPKWDGRSRWS